MSNDKASPALASTSDGGEKVRQDRLIGLVEHEEWDAVASLLQNSHPLMCSHRHKPYGWTVLHGFCSNGGIPVRIIELAASLYEDAVSMPDSYLGDTCLHIAGRNSQFSSAKLEALLRYCETDAVLLRNNLGGTALHSAANHNANLSALQLLVRANLAVLRVKTHEGIHAVTALWLAYVQTIPGHMAVVRILNGEDVESRAFERFWSKVEYLAGKHFGQSTSRPDIFDDENLYVLHGLLQCNVPMELLKVCLKYRLETALAVDAAGNLPLHVLVQNRPYRLKEREAIQACLDACPLAASVANHAGDVPLHIAIRQKIPVDKGVDLLLAAAPTTVQHRDNSTGLYSFQLAASQGSNVASVNTTFALLMHQPDLVRMAEVDCAS